MTWAFATSILSCASGAEFGVGAVAVFGVQGLRFEGFMRIILVILGYMGSIIKIEGHTVLRVASGSSQPTASPPWTRRCAGSSRRVGCPGCILL